MRKDLTKVFDDAFSMSSSILGRTVYVEIIPPIALTIEPSISHILQTSFYVREIDQKNDRNFFTVKFPKAVKRWIRYIETSIIFKHTAE